MEITFYAKIDDDEEGPFELGSLRLDGAQQHNMYMLAGAHPVALALFSMEMFTKELRNALEDKEEEDEQASPGPEGPEDGTIREEV